MTDYERQFETQNPADKLGTAILQLGIKPELAVELDPSEARVVVGALAKALSTLVHPDRGTRDEIFSLGIGEINYLGSLVAQADKLELGEALDQITETSVEVGTKKHNQLLGQELARTAEINKDLARAIIHSHESISEQLSMSFILMEPNVEDPDDPDNSAISVKIDNGVVTEAVAAKAHGSLLSTFSEVVQEKLAELRPDLDSTEQYVHLDTLFPDDESLRGWAKLVTVTSRKDPSVKKPAIKRYNADDAESYEVTDLVGARILGAFDYSTYKNNNFALSIDTPFQSGIKDSVDHGSSLKTYFRVRDEELVHLLGRGYVRTFRTIDDVKTAQQFVLHQPAGRGKSDINFVTTGVAAQAML